MATQELICAALFGGKNMEMLIATKLEDEYTSNSRCAVLLSAHFVTTRPLFCRSPNEATVMLSWLGHTNWLHQLVDNMDGEASKWLDYYR